MHEHKAYQLLFSLILLMGTVWMPADAQSEYPENDQAEYDCSESQLPPGEDESTIELLSFLDTPHERVSSGLEWLSKRIDTFFANEKIYQESTGSYARLSGSSILREGGKINHVGDLRVRVKLPKTKEKLKLLIESDTEEGLENRPSRLTQATPKEALSETDYYAAIEAKLPKQGRWDFHTSVGLKVRSPLDPFIRFRITREVLFTKWKFRFNETLFHFHSSGDGHSTALEWDRPFSKKDLFRSRSIATWRNETDTYELSQSFIMFHELSDKRALSYSLSIFGTNKPITQAESYLLDLRYRQRIHKDWLFYEINPQVLYQKINDFEAEHTLTLKLEMVFGDKYL